MTEEITIANQELAPAGETKSFMDQILIEAKEAGYFATFAVETMEDKKALYQARNNNELLRNHMGEVINAVHFVIDSQKVNDAEFGVKIVPCLHIIDEDGKVYQSSSTGVVDSACKLLSTFGLPDTWGEPLAVVCKETITASGFRYKYLELAS